MAENPTAGLTQEEEEDNIDYDSDGNPIPSTTKKIILPLPPIDHTEVHLFTLNQDVVCIIVFYVIFVLLFPFEQIEYAPFVKNFYDEHEELSSLTGAEVVELRQKLNLRVSFLFTCKWN